MSKIPRSFVTPSSKLPLTSDTPKMLEPSKISFSSVQKTLPMKNTPLHEITAEKINTSEKKSVLKKPEATTLKRNAAPEAQKLPNKQIKLAPKISNSSAKIAPYDYKARFNDLFDKHKLQKSQYSELKEKFEECTDELENVKSLHESVFERNVLATNELNSLSVDHTKLKSQYEVVNMQLDSEKKMNSELTTKISQLTNEFESLQDNFNKTSSQLSDCEQKLSYKTQEYSSLQSSFEKEVQKCSHLSSICDENQVKLLSLTSEITFLNTRQKILDQKNEENMICIANLSQEKSDMVLKLSKLNIDLENVKKTLEEKCAECNQYKMKLETEMDKNASLSIKVHNNEKCISTYESDLLELQKCKEFLQMNNEKYLREINDLKIQNTELQKTIESMHDNEKGLRNEIQDLKGHIRVFCRIRPPICNENSKQLLNVEVLDSCTMEIDKSVFNTVSGTLKKQKHNFSFDGIFSPQSAQCEIFSEVSSLIQSALDGYNVCIFAYGQTGSGKTFTMEGGSDSTYMGIIPRAINMIFSTLPDLKKIGWDFKITASFLEIYNENIYDLLDSNKDQDEHLIKMVDSKGTDVYVSNLKEESVSNAQELMKLLLLSQKNRQTAATLCNERSSRSHSVSKIKISAYHEQRKEKYYSNLNLVDLAGSESAKTSQRIDETKSINKSLSELSKVILALQSKQSHIPYRNSKLTYLLMPSLGGNSKTLMLVNIAQFDECYQETLNSLRFAAKVNSCRIGQTKKNISTA